MNKSTIANAFKSFTQSIKKHSPEILTGIGIAGMITTTVLAVKATPKAISLIEKEKERQTKVQEELNGPRVKVIPVEEIKPIDAIKVAWKCYIPSVVIGGASVACLIGASSVNAKRNAVLATAYKLSESALVEYREKVIETIGEKKERAIRGEINKDRLENNPVNNNNVIITGNGDTMCYDHYSKRYFKSNMDNIKKAINEINRIMLLESYVSLNDFYSEIGLDCTEYGDKMGWNTNKKLVEPCFDTHLSKDGTPCLVVDFVNPPEYNFDRFC